MMELDAIELHDHEFRKLATERRPTARPRA
jgi:hypothetical protein